MRCARPGRTSGNSNSSARLAPALGAAGPDAPRSLQFASVSGWTFRLRVVPLNGNRREHRCLHLGSIRRLDTPDRSRSASRSSSQTSPSCAPNRDQRRDARKGAPSAAASREIQARGRRSARGSSSKIAKPTATRCSLPSMLTLTFMTYWIRPSIRAGRGDHEGSRVYDAYNSKHVFVLTRLSQSVSSAVTTTISYGESQKRKLPSFYPGISCASTVWESRMQVRLSAQRIPI